MNSKVVLSITSWKKRIDTLPKMLFYFYATQLILPDIVILTLSSDEFPGKENDLPRELMLIVKQFNIQLNWIKENIYCHKKQEVFKKHNDDYVILADDDILYPKDYVSSLLVSAKQYNNCVHCYYGCAIEYSNGNRLWSDYTTAPSMKNVLLNGLSCYPPHTFPIESFKFTYARDKIVPKCDDSWINGWLIKNNTKIIALNDYRKVKLLTVKNSQDCGIWKTINSERVHGTLMKYIHMCKVFDFLNISDYVRDNLWKNINIDKYKQY